MARRSTSFGRWPGRLLMEVRRVVRRAVRKVVRKVAPEPARKVVRRAAAELARNLVHLVAPKAVGQPALISPAAAVAPVVRLPARRPQGQAAGAAARLRSPIRVAGPVVRLLLPLTEAAAVAPVDRLPGPRPVREAAVLVAAVREAALPHQLVRLPGARRPLGRLRQAQPLVRANQHRPSPAG
jgi:hypothetical protein